MTRVMEVAAVRILAVFDVGELRSSKVIPVVMRMMKNTQEMLARRLWGGLSTVRAEERKERAMAEIEMIASCLSGFCSLSLRLSE